MPKEWHSGHDKVYFLQKPSIGPSKMKQMSWQDEIRGRALELRPSLRDTQFLTGAVNSQCPWLNSPLLHQCLMLTDVYAPLSSLSLLRPSTQLRLLPSFLIRSFLLIYNDLVQRIVHSDGGLLS